MGGDYLSELYEHTTGIDIAGLDVQLAVGAELELPPSCRQLAAAPRWNACCRLMPAGSCVSRAPRSSRAIGATPRVSIKPVEGAESPPLRQLGLHWLHHRRRPRRRRRSPHRAPGTRTAARGHARMSRFSLSALAVADGDGVPGCACATTLASFTVPTPAPGAARPAAVARLPRGLRSPCAGSRFTMGPQRATSSYDHAQYHRPQDGGDAGALHGQGRRAAPERDRSRHGNARRTLVEREGRMTPAANAEAPPGTRATYLRSARTRTGWCQGGGANVSVALRPLRNVPYQLANIVGAVGLEPTTSTV